MNISIVPASGGDLMSHVLPHRVVEDPLISVAGHELYLTNHLLMTLVVAALMLLIFPYVASKIRTRGEGVEAHVTKGILANFFETLCVFLREEVTRPALGHLTDKYIKYIWTTFFFVLFCNLLGMVPWAGSPTGAWGMTGAMAMVTFCTVVGTGIKKHGPIGYWTGQVPHMELPLVMAVVIKPMVFVIEVVGLLIKHFVLSVRLLINMYAGHLVLAVLLGFITMTADQGILWYGVAPISILGTAVLSLLELFVAFLQAYIFAFLSALFIGMAVHQH